MTKISIITVCFNSEKHIVTAIESVLKQDYAHWEYIIVDGQSRDRTLDVIKNYELIFNDKLKLISEPDNGLYDAMNKGIRMATGDVIGILNSDDFFTSENILSVVAETFNDENIDAIYGDIHFVKPDNPDKCVRYYSSKRFHPRYFRLGFMPAHPSFYVRRWCFEKYGDYVSGYTISADFDLMVRFIYKHKIRYKYIPVDFVTMRIGGASTKNIKSRWVLNKEDIRICRKHGIYTNWFYMGLRYLYKIKEFFNLQKT
ncbi:MAG: glycosyltransferase [Bacteroidales bacterium]|jgi:glycosyltransferase involved in cell wall biosynthesis|nr:glycosyltransferase [Bacteroidales bacterium]